MNAKLTRWAAALALATLVGAAPRVQAAEKPKTTEAIVAVFALDRPITETPSEDFLFTAVRPEALKDLIARMNKARDDDKVKAAVILLGNTSLGRGQAEEIRTAMKGIRDAGKEVCVHADSLTTGHYVLASGASRVSVVPTGYLFLTGLYGEAPYVRGLLDKIGVIPDYMTCGAYKSAAEIFMRTGPSPEAEQMQNWLFDGIFESDLAKIAEGRGKSPKQVRKWIDGGLYSAEEAAKLEIIDAAQQPHELVAELESKFGEDVKLDLKYGKKSSAEIDLSSPMGVLQLWAKLLGAPEGKAGAKDAVAIVYVDGAILPGKPDPSLFGTTSGAYSTPIRKALDKALEDDSVKAVVLRIDSPGGSAVASEIILSATKRVAAKKPLVVSMGDVAGSGGYYVACGAETIFADATTITGSIGVVGGKFATTAMWDMLGIQWKAYARGDNADLLSSASPFTDAQRKKLQSWMDEIYGVFKQHVVDARGRRLKKPIDEIAGGRVYTGRQGLELGLVDQIGGLDEAVRFAAGKANLKENAYDVRVLPRPKNPMELLFGDLSDGDDDGRISLSATIPSLAPSVSLWDRVLPLLEGLDPQRTEAIKAAILRMEMLQQDGAVLMMPEMVLRDEG
jgi:protease-4